MQITFYSTDDGENVINKTLSNGVTIPIQLKRETDILSPVLTLTNKTGIDYTQFNYCYIDVLKRFYFVKTVKQLNSALFQLELSCDVLETFKRDILKCNARFKRGVKNGDTQQQNTVKEVNKKFTIYKSNVSIDYSKQNIILTTVGATK